MRKLVIVFLLCLLGTLYAETRIVSLTDARRIADSNAAILWGGNLGSAEPIPYYGPDDKIIAYHFNYAIGRPFPDKHSLQQRSGEAFSSGNRDLGWGVGEFGNMVIGANRGMPVFIEYGKGLSYILAMGNKLEEVARKEFPAGYTLEKTYYLGLVHIWHKITSGTEVRYINLQPYTKVIGESEFREMVSTRAFFWERGNFDEEWTTFLDNDGTIGRSDVWVVGEEYMPFYEWSYGCTPTAAAMICAWWDHYKGYSRLIDYHISRGDPVQDGYDHHVPTIQGLLAAHMDTDPSTGGTAVSDISDGIINAVESLGYECSSDGLIGWNEDSNDVYWEIIDQIDGNHPCMVGIDRHSIAGVGYNLTTRSIIIHDSNRSYAYQITRSMLERYQWVSLQPISNNYYLEITYPNGGEVWGSNIGGGTLISGVYYDITWNGMLSSETYAKLYYHHEGGQNPDRWFPITTFTPNDGHYQWLVPIPQDCVFGINTDYSRVKIEIYDLNTHEMLAADGSFGNFKTGGSFTVPELTLNATHLFGGNNLFVAPQTETGTWGAVIVKEDPLMLGTKIELFNGPDFYQEYVESISSEKINYVMINNHQLLPREYGVRISNMYSTDNVSTWASNSSIPGLILNPGTPHTDIWTSGVLGKVFNVYLNPGSYFFEMTMDSYMNLDFALFTPFGAGGIYTYNQAAAYSRNSLFGGSEGFFYTVPEAGYYGLIVTARVNGVGTYNINIHNPGKWLGTADTNWFNPANWIGNSVPNFTNDVVIPGGCPNYPIILTGTYPEIKSISVEANALLTIGATEMNVHQSMQVYGIINMTSNSSVLSVGENLYWGAGSSLVGSIYNYQIVCYKNWDFGLGSNIQMTSGTVVFWGDQDSYVTTSSATSKFNNVTLNKITAGRSVIHSEYSSNDWRIYGNLTISNSNTTLSSETDKKIQIYSSITNNGHIQLDNGTVDFKIGSSLPVLNTGDYFYGLTISTTTALSLPSNYSISGDLTISSGGINANTRAITLSGNFINNVGPAGFVKGTSTVIFNGGGDQRCTNGNFYRMEIASQYCNVIFTGAGATSTCDIYDWTAGSLEVEQGTLNILDLADNGLYGNYMLTGGTLNVNQDNSQYTDLNGSLYIYSGTMNVYGGNGNSYWPYAANAHIEMHGGVLDFRNRGIYIYNSPTYTLTTELRGGIIRTAGSFLCYRPDFWFADEHYIELYGSTDANIYLHSSAGFHSFIFNKGSARADACPAGLDQIEREGVELPVELRSSNSSATRANTVNLISNVYIFGDLIIESGTVNLNRLQPDH